MTQRFSLGNFNVRNLVPGSTKRQHNFFYAMSRRNSYWAEGEREENRYQQKIHWLARQLDRMQADIVCFQEVFDPEPLRDVIGQSGYDGQAEVFMAGEPVFEAASYRGSPARIYQVPRVAAMVAREFELVQMQTLAQFPEDFDIAQPVEEQSGRVWRIGLSESDTPIRTFNRPVLKLRIRLPARFAGARGVSAGAPEITVFSAHLKSKRPIQRAIRDEDPVRATAAYLRESALGKARALLLRSIEAAALRTYVLRELLEHPQRPVLVLGDLNDGPRSVTTELVGGLTQPVFHHDVEPDRQRRERMFEAAADLSLYSAYDLQTRRTHRDVYYTHIFDGFHDTLDHVLLSSHFVPLWARDGRGRVNLGKVGTLRVFNDHLVNADVDDIQSDKVGKYMHTRSDHGQVTVRIDWFEA